MYARFCSDIGTQKAETHQTRLTAGGDRFDYEGRTSTDTAGLETVKIHSNSTISRKEAYYYHHQNTCAFTLTYSQKKSDKSTTQVNL